MYAERALLTSALALFVVSLGYGVVVPVLPELAGSAGSAASAQELSVVYAAYSVAKIAAQVPGGVWVDRSGPRRVALVGASLFALSLAAFLVRAGPLWFAFARALEGAGTGLVYPAVFARVLAGSKEGDSGRRLGRTIGLGSAGLLLGPVLAFSLVRFGLAAPILVALALALVALVAVALSFEGPAAPAGPPRVVSDDLRAIGRMARSGTFVAIMLPLAFNKLTFSAYQGLLPLVGADALSVGHGGVAALFVEIGVIFAVTQPFAGALADRVDARRVAVVGLLVEAVTLVMLAAARDPFAFAAVFGAHIVAQSVVFTASTKHAALAFGAKESYGGLFGVMATLTDSMTVVGPLVFLNLYAPLGARVFLVMAAVAAAVNVAYLLAPRGRPGALDVTRGA